MKRNKRVAISVIIIILINSNIIYATTKAELESQKNSIEEKIDKTSTEIQGVKVEMSTNLQEISKLNEKISDYDSEIATLETEIKSLEESISEKEENIKQEEEKYNIQKELLDKRLIALYEAGSTSYLDVLLSADSLTDFISKYYLVSTIAESDQELLAKIENTKNQIEKEKEDLEASKEKVENSKIEIEEKEKLISASINTKKSIVAKLSSEEKELQEELEGYEEDQKEIANQLAKLVSNSSKPSNFSASSSGYISPLAGKTKSNITTGFYGYTNHKGVDFACSSGTEILAVKDGVVVISDALKNPNGTYRSYGEYVAINHYDGTVTLYAHMLSGSRKVEVGSIVKQGEVIGKVGATGNATGPHLHFEVRTNNGQTRIDPTPYLP
jgi:murein DD-endopeptidase MepM/ murein hydrolase activator NlpD